MKGSSRLHKLIAMGKGSAHPDADDQFGIRSGRGRLGRKNDLSVVGVKDRRRRIMLGVSYVIAALVVTWLIADGWSYYLTPYVERPHHEAYRVLRSAGSRGLILGIVGAAMMVLMLVYTLQKRFRLFGRRLPLRPFLDFHIFCGIVGPLLIVLHTSFKVQGLVAISFWSMVAVAVSGYLGRYLHLQIPRSRGEKEMSLKEIEALNQKMTQELATRTGLGWGATSGALKAFEGAFIAKANSAGVLILKLMIKDLLRLWRKGRLKRNIARICRIPRSEVQKIYELATKLALLKRRMLILDRVQRLFHYWHVIHKPFAIIMYLIMLLHIGVAVWTGYGWIG